MSGEFLTAGCSLKLFLTVSLIIFLCRNKNCQTYHRDYLSRFGCWNRCEGIVLNIPKLPKDAKEASDGAAVNELENDGYSAQAGNEKFDKVKAGAAEGAGAGAAEGAGAGAAEGAGAGAAEGAGAADIFQIMIFMLLFICFNIFNQYCILMLLYPLNLTLRVFTIFRNIKWIVSELDTNKQKF
ncbi:hypothetical protein BpHYR1_035053 [Brachionus plicatilis]|uniref:Uncharacterized protein n=1 Tax=Brachionus plicatilis TaxID=10195 RepID=A0A3M7SZ54_BRAPC|nr:hypothetical protein BpHYR1_035053 [Brachionus plicatilis]